MDRTTVAVTTRRVPEEQQQLSRAGRVTVSGQWKTVVRWQRASPAMESRLQLTCGTLALIAIRVIDALGPIQTRSTRAIVNVNLAHWARETLKRHRSDTNQRLTHLPLLKEWVKSSVEQMPMGHQADDSPWQVTGTSGQSSEVRGPGASTVTPSEHRNLLQNKRGTETLWKDGVSSK